jgi:two-component system sensor histidine kinase KdpD
MNRALAPLTQSYVARLARMNPLAQAAISLGVLVLLTLLLVNVRPLVRQTTAELLYILLVLVSATTFGRWPSMLVGSIAALAFNFFFVPPYSAFGFNAPEDALRLVTFLSVALLVSTLASRAQAQALMAQQRATELSALYNLSQAISADIDLNRTLPTIARTSLELLSVTACTILLYDEQGQLVERTSVGHVPPAAATLDVPIRTEQRNFGLLRVARQQAQPALNDEEHEMLETVAAQAALVLERARLSAESTQVQALAASDQLKSTLLTSVSHDLRTPLAVIKGAVTGLLDESIPWDSEARRDLLASVNEETDHLNRLVGDLLEMSRIEAGALSHARTWLDFDELIVTVADQMQRRSPNHCLVLAVPNDLPLVQGNYAQLERVVINLLQNAVNYSPSGSPVEVRAQALESHDAGPQHANPASACYLLVEVADHGPGIPEPLKHQIFDKFVRAAPPERHAEGSGLGLAICKGLIEAHGGRIWAENLPRGGARFSFTLPVPANAPTVLEDVSPHTKAQETAL